MFILLNGIRIKFAFTSMAFSISRFRNTHVNGFFDTQSAPMQLIINTAIGGDFLEDPDGSTVWPQYFEVDYVYVYQKQADRSLAGYR